MKKEKLNLEPIEGFKVMEWLRGVREADYRLYKENPQEYFKRIGVSYEEVKKRRTRREYANKARKQPVPAA